MRDLNEPPTPVSPFSGPFSASTMLSVPNICGTRMSENPRPSVSLSAAPSARGKGRTTLTGLLVSPTPLLLLLSSGVCEVKERQVSHLLDVAGCEVPLLSVETMGGGVVRHLDMARVLSFC